MLVWEVGSCAVFKNQVAQRRRANSAHTGQRRAAKQGIAVGAGGRSQAQNFVCDSPPPLYLFYSIRPIDTHLLKLGNFRYCNSSVLINWSISDMLQYLLIDNSEWKRICCLCKLTNICNSIGRFLRIKSAWQMCYIIYLLHGLQNKVIPFDVYALFSRI